MQEEQSGAEATPPKRATLWGMPVSRDPASSVGSPSWPCPCLQEDSQSQRRGPGLLELRLLHPQV